MSKSSFRSGKAKVIFKSRFLHVYRLATFIRLAARLWECACGIKAFSKFPGNLMAAPTNSIPRRVAC